MATLSRAENKHMYSWWWDSHISPKNSKWLQENLTDMDGKVKTMIKLIEVDEDTFARRAEMYYKKRPELMKLVEEFYRAYRALAERYDHATGVIRQAHKTMAEHEVPFVMSDDGPVNGSDPHTPEMQAPLRASFDPDELLKGEIGLSSTDFFSGKGNVGKARKGLNFAESLNKKENGNSRVLSESERLGKSENDIQALKDALAKLESEKEAGLLQYKQTLERLSKLESEVSRANENSRGLNERANKAEAEVQSLKENLAKVEVEREASLCQYRECLDRISNLETHVSETEFLKEELTRLRDEKEALLSKYMEALEKIANLENKLLLAEDYATTTSDRADNAEKDVETLRENIAKLTDEKEAAVLNYKQCLETISALESEIALMQEEAEKLKAEVRVGAVKLKGSEEQCHVLYATNRSLQSEVESLVQRVGNQNLELSEKQRELGRLWTCVQEERMRFMETETAFESLRNLHSKVQEELRSVAGELQRKVQLLKDMEDRNRCLDDEVKEAKKENETLNDLNMSAAVSMKGLQEENFELKEVRVKLEEELELRLDERNGLQQEIYCLKEDLSNLRQRHRDVVDQVESVGFDPESIGSSVKELRDENSKLAISCQRNDTELAALVEKLGVMEKLVEKKAILENSLSELRVELEGAREKVKVLEESCQLLMREKSELDVDKGNLVTQLLMTTENLEVVSERNTFLEKSLFDANAELEILRAKSKTLEESCRILNDQNSVLVTEKKTLASQLETTQHRLDDLGKIHADLEVRYSGLEEERRSTLQQVEKLQVCLDVEKQEHADVAHASQVRIADLENQICWLQVAGDNMRADFEAELDKAVNAQFDIFVLQKSIQDLKDKNLSLMAFCEKLLEASRLSEKLISELEGTKQRQEEEMSVLSSQSKGLRMGIFQLLETLETELGPACDAYNDDDEGILQHILVRLENIRTSLWEAWDENHKLVVEKSVLIAVLRQLKNDTDDLNVVALTLRHQIEDRNEQLLVLQMEMQKLLQSNEELIFKVREGNKKEVVLLAEIDTLEEKLFYLQTAYEELQKENGKVIEDKQSLTKAFEDLEKEKHHLEQECLCITEEVVALENLSVVLKLVISEKAAEVVELTENIDRLCNDNGLLVERVRIVEGKVEEVFAENVGLEVSLKKLDNELKEERALNGQLQVEMAKGKDMLCSKEMELSEAEAIIVDQESQIRNLSDNYGQQVKESQSQRALIENLESRISKMCKEYEESEGRARALSSEVQKGKDEVKLWEIVAGSFFIELQSASVREALIKEKYCELIKAYEVLEAEGYSKCKDIDQLRERVGVLEGENSDVKTKLAASHSALLSLRDTVSSLEKHTILHNKLRKTDNEDKEDGECCQSGSFDLQEVQARIQAVEKAVIELKQQTKEEHSTVRSDLDLTMRQIEVLKSQSGSRRGVGRSSRRFDSKNVSVDDNKPQKTTPSVRESGNEILMKDIMLDQASDCSSYGKKKKNMGSDDQVLELWETMDQGGSIDLTVGKPYRSTPSHLNVFKGNKSGRPSVESTVDKELCVDDQQEISKRLSKDEYKRKTLEKLASDVQKLTNIQITVQDLKEKLAMTEHKGKSVEYDGVKDQISETEETISKLFDYSRKLMKKIENSSTASSSFDGSVAADSSDNDSAKRRRCSEQARRISEKIGRLQLEVQKVQFLLMKQDTQKASKGGTRIMERSTRILLRDYLYGGGSKTPRRRKKTHFCGCVQPPTKSD